MVILVDCDNFFASCERVMQPRLNLVPVAVLSNNDGCIIARTSEVKAAGVTMGQPYHECKETLDRIGTTVVSANFLLYRNLAKRLQTILRALPSTHIEVYSIDESFLEMPDEAISDPQQWAETLRKTVFDWIGLPVSISIAPSRALAKLASGIAKKDPHGVCVLAYKNGSDIERSLRATPVADVWGVGRRLSPKLRLCGVRTAWDLMQLEPTDPVFKMFDRPTIELISELRGWSAPSANSKVTRKSIMHSRSFGKRIDNDSTLRAVFADFSTEIATKLRKKQLLADRAVFSVRYKADDKKFGVSKSVEIRFNWTNDAFDFASAAEDAAKKLFESDKQYTKAMVLCPSLQPHQQLSLYDDKESHAQKTGLMEAIDELETRYGAAGPHIATKLLNDSWRGKRQFVSPYNNAEWSKLPPVKSG